MNKQFSLSKEGDTYTMTIKIPATQPIYDYVGEEEIGTTDTIIGLVESDGNFYGLSYLIDMSYKDKGPQASGMIVELSTFMTFEEFEDFCLNNRLSIIYTD